jgi:hypothetical protein
VIKLINKYGVGMKIGSQFPYNVDTISVQKVERSAFDFIRKINDGTLMLFPDFQRSFVWTPKQQSRFIESILLKIPIPIFYFAEDKTGTWIVVDGLQRLQTLRLFLTDDFKLEGIELLPFLNGRGFLDLEQKLKNRIQDASFTAFVIQPETPDKVKIDIFDRVNTAGTKLTKQELRHCLFQGDATQFLKELAELHEFKEIFNKNDHKVIDRMRDREVILRFISFYYRKYENYLPEMDEFLNNSLKSLNNEPKQVLENLKDKFLTALSNSKIILGENAFRKKNKAGRWGRFNVALFESIMYYMADLPEEKAIENKEIIKKRLVNDILTNHYFFDSISQNTNNLMKVRMRFEMAKLLVEGL